MRQASIVICVLSIVGILFFFTSVQYAVQAIKQEKSRFAYDGEE